MSIILQRHHAIVIKTVSAYRSSLQEIEADLRVRAMSNDASLQELALLRRLKDEMANILRSYENLEEAFKALVQNNTIRSG
ncbi:hypothetical protein DSM25558_3060 [Agrobacterium sp. DSM 25558]|uniref:Uncharacterized protein n=1 Tax=Agrobacterium rosae TaxID=1972867 RepID=A0A1R3U2G0_9HYPH|nr:hypothetical protein DSM25558_3060 [Agrobacterium sp. DSM 25558]SCX35603.1 hypothetical protein DSM25559_5048 [Agrobacterium rosae]